MVEMPPSIADAVRAMVGQYVRAYAASAAEVAELRQIIDARLCSLSADDRRDLARLLSALPALVADGVPLTAAEVRRLAASAPAGPAADALRAAVARFTDRPGDDENNNKALGRFLARCAGWPVHGRCLERIPAGKKACLYAVRFLDGRNPRDDGPGVDRATPWAQHSGGRS